MIYRNESRIEPDQDIESSAVPEEVPQTNTEVSLPLYSLILY